MRIQPFLFPEVRLNVKGLAVEIGVLHQTKLLRKWIFFIVFLFFFFEGGYVA